jgi:hypothetical protein
MLVNFLMETLDVWLNAALQIVATVCDMAANSRGDETVGFF